MNTGLKKKCLLEAKGWHWEGSCQSRSSLTMYLQCFALDSEDVLIHHCVLPSCVNISKALIEIQKSC